jgi:hypothetical protein
MINCGVGGSLWTPTPFSDLVAVNAYWAVVALALCFGCVELTEGAFWGAVMMVGRSDTTVVGNFMNTAGTMGGIIGIPIVAYLSGHQQWQTAFSIGASENSARRWESRPIIAGLRARLFSFSVLLTAGGPLRRFAIRIVQVETPIRTPTRSRPSLACAGPSAPPIRPTTA